MGSRQPCAGAVVFDAGGRLLLVRRANPPAAGSWTVPGGRCRAAEDPAAACVREVREETGLTVRVLREAGRVERPGPDGVVYDIVDFACEVSSGELRAGDDAAAAGWFDRIELAGLALAPGLLDALTAWGLLPD